MFLSGHLAVVVIELDRHAGQIEGTSARMLGAGAAIGGRTGMEPSHTGFGEGWTGMALGLRKADEPIISRVTARTLPCLLSGALQHSSERSISAGALYFNEPRMLYGRPRHTLAG